MPNSQDNLQTHEELVDNVKVPGDIQHSVQANEGSVQVNEQPQTNIKVLDENEDSIQVHEAHSPSMPKVVNNPFTNTISQVNDAAVR